MVLADLGLPLELIFEILTYTGVGKPGGSKFLPSYHIGLLKKQTTEEANQACSAAPFLDQSRATVIPSYFSTRNEAMREIGADGWWPMAWIDKPGASYPAHFHKGAEALYMIDGDLEFTDLAAGATHSLKAGDKLILPARVVHSVLSRTGATYLLGLSVLVPFEDHFIAAGNAQPDPVAAEVSR